MKKFGRGKFKEQRDCHVANAPRNDRLIFQALACIFGGIAHKMRSRPYPRRYIYLSSFLFYLSTTKNFTLSVIQWGQ